MSTNPKTIATMNKTYNKWTKAKLIDSLHHADTVKSEIVGDYRWLMNENEQLIEIIALLKEQNALLKGQDKPKVNPLLVEKVKLMKEQNALLRAETAANAPIKTTPKEDRSQWAPNLTTQQNRWWDEQIARDPRMASLRSGY